MIKTFNEYRINESRSEDRAIDEVISLLSPLFADGVLTMKAQEPHNYKWDQDIICADEQRLNDTIQQIHNAGTSNSRDKYDNNRFYYKAKKGDYTISFYSNGGGSFSRFYVIEIINNTTKYRMQMLYSMSRRDGSIYAERMYVGPKYSTKLTASDPERAFNDIKSDVFGI